MKEQEKTRFSLGRLVATRSIAERMEKDLPFREFCNASVHRHSNADWGDLDEEDKKLNEEALKSGEDRLFSVYIFQSTKEKIWIITEWDNSMTTILYPSEY